MSLRGEEKNLKTLIVAFKLFVIVQPFGRTLFIALFVHFLANCIFAQEIDLASCIYTCQVFVYKQCNEKPVFYVSTKLKDVNCLQ